MNQTDDPISLGTVKGTTVSKERELPQTETAEAVQPIAHEVEIPTEIEKVGVTATHETIELPPDITKLGVMPTTPVATPSAVTLPTVTLPISDNQVVTGLHAKVISSLRWLAVWCIKKLRKAHIALKVIHGKIMRVKT